MARERNFMGRAITEFEEGRPVIYFLPRCDGCGAEEKIRTPTRKMAPEPIAKRLRERGWQVGGKLACPACQERRRAAPEPETPASSAQEIHMAAALPPTPLNPEQRRRIREALYEHYLEEKGCYRQAFSDKSLAAKLNLPWAWVKELREALGFGPDANEAREFELAEVAAVTAELGKLSDEFLTRIGALEARLKRLEVDRAYAAA